MCGTLKNTIQVAAEIIANRLVAENTYFMRLKAPELAARAGPGQFVKLRGWPAPAEGGTPLLDRPFSLHRLGPEGAVCFLYRVVGRGTSILAGLRPGQKVKVLGPLGRGLATEALASESRRVYLAAGGIGVAPMAMVGEALKNLGLEVILYYGERRASFLTPPELLFPYVDDLEMCVEQNDQSSAPNTVVGRPADFLEKALAGRPGPIFACGPLPMLAGLAELAQARGVAYYPSLEARMACGFGVCLSCVMPRAGGGHISVCRDGPVIEGRRLDWAALKKEGGWGA